LNQNLLEIIQKLHDEKLSSRKIARQLGIGKSTVNRYLSKSKQSAPDPVKKFPKVLFIDIETSPSIVATFGRFKQNIGQDNVIQEGGVILTACYKWQHEQEVKSIVDSQQIYQNQDLYVCDELYKLVNEADTVIGHNLRNFDIKVLNSRLCINGFGPVPSSVKIIDTLEMAKKYFRFNSNKLDSLGQILGVGEKVKHEGILLWLKVMQGDIEAISKMVEYNIQDVVLLEKVYDKLMQFGVSSSYNAALYFDDDDMRCKHCGSNDVEFTGGYAYTSNNKFKEVICNSCNSLMRSKYSETNTEKRKNLLTSIS